MILLLDIGNTHTHLGLASRKQIRRHRNIPTQHWFGGAALRQLRQFLKGATVEGTALCSVVPRATVAARKALHRVGDVPHVTVGPKTAAGVGIDYPKPETIGPDRLANAVAARHYFGSPSVVVDFGTAVTFDVVDARGCYVGGIIAPGLAAMTDYLHEKTALLPRIQIREVKRTIGKNTAEAMLIGAVHGYRGLIHELVSRLKTELNARDLPVVATGGCAELMAARLPEITAVRPLLTLEGLRLVWLNWSSSRSAPGVA